MRNAQCTMHNGARIAGVAWTFLMVMLGWVFFAAKDFHGAAAFFRSLAGKGGADVSILAAVTPQAICAMAVGTLLSFIPAFVPKLGIAEWRLGPDARNASILSRTIATALLLLLATLPLLTSGFSPFIYNRF